MGFWSTLGKIGLGIGGAVAAPLTGGASLIPSLIGVGGNIASGVIGSRASNRAADQQVGASREAIDALGRTTDEQRGIRDTSAGYTDPYRNAGAGAVGRLSDLLGEGGALNDTFTGADLENEPGYQFRLREGQRALQATAAARGSLLSGGTLRSLSRYGQDYASNEYQNAFDRFNTNQENLYRRNLGLTGIGQVGVGQAIGANNAFGNQLTGYGQNLADLMTGAGNARAAGTLRSGTAVGDAVSGVTDALGGIDWSRLLRRPGSPTILSGAPNPEPPEFLGARQFGGPVDPNRMYTVGEDGPEKFVPDQPGTIIPNPLTRGAQSAPTGAPVAPWLAPSTWTPADALGAASYMPAAQPIDQYRSPTSHLGGVEKIDVPGLQSGPAVKPVPAYANSGVPGSTLSPTSYGQWQTPSARPNNPWQPRNMPPPADLLAAWRANGGLGGVDWTRLLGGR